MNHLVKIFLFGLLLVAACKPDKQVLDEGVDLSAISYQPTAFDQQIPAYLGKMYIPADNPMTVDGVALGRFLFFDPILSKDSTIACGSCHKSNGAFTDNEKFSKGVNGSLGNRSSMSLVNVGFHYNGLFWDGRDSTLEQQALDPIEHPLEMKETWPNVEKKLKRSTRYQGLFRKAFGINNSKEITRQLAAKAIAQYERALVSANSKFDQVVNQNKGFFNDSESDGYDMYFNHITTAKLPDAQCGHCHQGPLLTDNQYRNNGIDSFAVLTDYPDPGRGGVTKQKFDYGRFRNPTLRNIGYTAPYMHDGRFTTLDEVLDHYVNHIKKVENLDITLYHVDLTPKQVQDLKAFIKTLDDPDVLTKEIFLSPYK